MYLVLYKIMFSYTSMQIVHRMYASAYFLVVSQRVSSHLDRAFLILLYYRYYSTFQVQPSLCVCVCLSVVIPFTLDVRFVDLPAGVTQEEGHTGFLHLPSAVVALVFLARRIQPFLSLVEREVEFCVLTN